MRSFVHTWCTPTGLLAVFVFLLPWQARHIFGWSYLSGDPTQFGTLSLYVTQVLLVVGLLIIYTWRGLPQFQNIDRRIFIIIGAFFLLNIISAFAAKSSVPALAGLLDLFIAMLFSFALLDNRVDIKRVFFAFILGLCLPVSLGFFQVFSGSSGPSTLLGLASRDAERAGDSIIVLADGVRVLRAYGSFSHPNVFGGYLAVGLLSALAYRSLNSQRADRVSVAIITIILAVGLVLTASRSAIFGFGLGLLIVLLAKKFKFRNSLMPIAVGAVFFALFVTYLTPSIVTSIRGGGPLENRSISERVQQYHDWPSTMNGADWLIGNGPRNYVFALADEHPQQSVWSYQPIHNLPLLMLSELGIMGFLLALILGVLILRCSSLPYAAGMASAVFVIMFFDHYLWSSWVGLALMGYVLAITTRQENILTANNAS